MLNAVGLDVKPVVANDPFFGRGGRMMAADAEGTGSEVRVGHRRWRSAEKPTAIASCNYHLDHFGHAFGIQTADGRPAHTACIGFGLERIALALVHDARLRSGSLAGDVKKVLGL